MEAALSCNLNIPDNKGMTPLMYACRYGHVQVVQEILRFQDVDTRMKDKVFLVRVPYIFRIRGFLKFTDGTICVFVCCDRRSSNGCVWTTSIARKKEMSC